MTNPIDDQQRRVVHGTISNEEVVTAGERIPSGSMIYIHPVTGLAYVCKTIEPVVISGTANTPKLDDTVSIDTV